MRATRKGEAANPKRRSWLPMEAVCGPVRPGGLHPVPRRRRKGSSWRGMAALEGERTDLT